jgi:hypothetical protein
MRAEALVLAFAGATTLALPCAAFCRTTTCIESECQPDASCPDCLVGGQPLFWPGGCLSFAVQQNGSPLRGIDAEAARLAISNGFERWLDASCPGGEAPGLAVYDYGLVECSRETFDQEGPNANIWMFRDTNWPYESWKLAVTTVRFNPESAQIRDVDVELNSEGAWFSLDGSGEFDLSAVVTHEAGHFLGLSHVCDTDATMYPDYRAASVTLGADDVSGICAAYPPGTLDEACNPEPRNGFSSTCPEDESGCAACGAARGSSSAADPLVLVAGVVLLLRRRRFRTSSRSRAPRTARCR